MISRKPKHIWEFGDFQTPQELATSVINILDAKGFVPQSILEPTCGKGEFLLAAYKVFPNANSYVGIDINSSHLQLLKNKINHIPKNRFKLINADFFTYNWDKLLLELDEPLLILGNPPWVTNAELSELNSSNIPTKSNFQGKKGLDALTGKSNFDISEWMLIKHLEWLQKKKGFLAMLCKTSVARKVLKHGWKNCQSLSTANIYQIDALKHFKASVDACLFVVDCRGKKIEPKCEVYYSLEDKYPSSTIGYDRGKLISNINLFKKYYSLLEGEDKYIWRSGVKHDCSKIMEVKKKQELFCNGNGEIFELEDTLVYPLYKSSDLNKPNLQYRKYVIITQEIIGQDTAPIAKKAPKTWNYLVKHGNLLDKRKSSIYKNRPRFSIFGIGQYAFYPWKVAISGFYKVLNFKVLPPVNSKPVMVDDTVYFLGCRSQQEAIFLADILNSQLVKEALDSIIFWNDKRPITVEILKRINLRAVAKQLSREDEYINYVDTQIKAPEQKY